MDTQHPTRIRQSATYWSFREALGDFRPFVTACRTMGLDGVDLVERADWPVVKEAGLVATMVPGAGTIASGLNDPDNRAALLDEFRRNIPAAAEAGWPNVITFSGSRSGRSDEASWETAATVLREVAPLAEEVGVTICVELLNSKVDHPDYQCDHTSWGVELCRRVNSPRVKLLYDVYHMQIMEGDIIRSIRDNIEWIGHFHTAGNPGRRDLDDEQEINYRAVAQTIAELVWEGRYDGYVAHEFIPKHGAESLQSAIALFAGR